MAAAPPANLFGEFEEEKGWRAHCNKGTISNIITFAVMVVGFALSAAGHDEEPAVQYVVACGVFGFAGGITNWVAVEMLFRKIPGVAGSGVILRQFVPIRESIKAMMMEMFFEVEFMRVYIARRALDLVRELDVSGRITRMMSEPEFDAILRDQIVALAAQPEGMLLQSMAGMFGGVDNMVPMLKPMLVRVSSELGGQAAERFDPFETWPVEQMRTFLDDMLQEKLLLLTPLMVKDMMEALMRKHCTWLVVWGNVFGGLIGVASHWAGY
jgi:hypothetical protein